MKRTLFTEVHDDFRAGFRAFVEAEILPHHDEWERQGRVDHTMFKAAGEAGYLATAVPEEYGGLGQDDFRFNAIIGEELQRAGVIGSGMCITLHNDVVLPYLLDFTTEEQRRRWLPGVVSGDIMGAIAMTEPETGSDLAALRTTARREGDAYVVNGAKTFVTNGLNADLYVVAVRTGPGERHRGISLIAVEDGTPGFGRGRHLDKIGLHSQDTAELFFDEVRVPAANLIGEEGRGFHILMRNLAQERLGLTVSAISAARAALTWTVRYCAQRTAFGRRVLDMQNTRFTLADLATRIEIGQVFVDRLIEAHGRGELTSEDAAKAKLYTTELQQQAVNEGLQLHGGYGFIREFPIARAYLDARIQTIFGGTNEIMREIIGRGLEAAYGEGSR
ncbi:alkylation response protein AidB-like acyl-CoA dehydrogenase [Spinactinospora alkalitolerans]|uniref:Acyl-[acyl-carrier-protein] dehydrogenase MbtN n=1 Tax=Spinactinospora alkalitolerans TaxID=687207 RepID=A0A852TYH0_9ACTN|nr:acyl-CoA dehydrogenase family protein [Spinactinospora alkalitolerans]NYE47843.1 alkylation response protein AidB-like acyl-CoA dehydrogenase [Spinactinospora alkalitolerans]